MREKTWRQNQELLVIVVLWSIRREIRKGLNKVLHQYGQYIVGRMGIPYHKRNVNIISVVIDAG